MDSNFVPFYLKYRPQVLAEVIGQEAVKKTIYSAFKSNRLSHAYLFVGPKGTGKTSMARILAKMVNCEMLKETEASKATKVTDVKTSDASVTSVTSDSFKIPCNKCSICLSITDGSNLDLIEIDAASNRGIEDIRSLRDKIKLAPSGAKRKVYIIDEVHMLTPEAFNALLKTLEEPPKHALFILATTDPTKLPQTILSRCIRMEFKLAQPSELMEALQKIVMMEKIDIDENALKLLVKKSDGSFRDGVKLLDQVSCLVGKITLDVLEKNLKSSTFDDILDLIESSSKKDTKTALWVILKQIEYGVEVKELILSLMDILRNLVFIKNGLGDELVSSGLTEDKYEQLIKVSDNLSNQYLVRSLNILQRSFEKLKFTSIPSLPLELAVVEICSEHSENSEFQIKSENQKVREPETQKSDTPSSSDSSDILKLKEKWTFVLETIRPYNFSLEALLRSVRISSINEVNVIMEVPYSFHQRILEAPKNRDILEGILSDVLGRQIKVSCVLGTRRVQREDLANVEVAEDDEIIRIASEIFNSDSVN